MSQSTSAEDNIRRPSPRFVLIRHSSVYPDQVECATIQDIHHHLSQWYPNLSPIAAITPTTVLFYDTLPGGTLLAVMSQVYE